MSDGPSLGFSSSSGPAAGMPQVVVLEPRWRRVVPSAERVARRAARLASATHPHPGALTVVLADDRTVRRLNARHRGRNAPTNVLTYESGDILLALGTVRREAEAGGKRAAHHLAHLVVHGALHLLGEDHHTAGLARRMERREARLLARLGVPNPWRPRP